MKYYLLGICLLTLMACRDESNKNTAVTARIQTLNTDGLTKQVFTINTSADTVLRTASGALLQIAAGAIINEEGTASATIELREAYSLLQMVKAGLLTQANGDPLSSGGMFYIDAAEGEKLRIAKSIKISIPTEFAVDSMQLFKGSQADNGTINWTDPKPLSPREQKKELKDGKTIFLQQCASCHILGKELSGPDLAHFPKRFNVEGWGYRWTHPYHISEESEIIGKRLRLYRCNLIKRYGSIGPVFDLSEKDLKAINAYIQDESNRRSLPLPKHASLQSSVDSCLIYDELTRELKDLKKLSREKREKWIEKNGYMVNQYPDTSQTPAAASDTIPLQTNQANDAVEEANFDSQYYEFTIENFGWFNVDILLKNLPGVESSSLLVRVQGSYRERIAMRLIIPSLQAALAGGESDDKEFYAFYKKNGIIPLPQGATAYILAMTESEEGIAYSLTPFTIGREQRLTVDLKPATKEEFNAALQVFAQQGWKVTVADSRNAIQIRAEDAELKKLDARIKEAEKLRPIGCDCDCILWEQTAAKDSATSEDYSTSTMPKK